MPRGNPFVSIFLTTKQRLNEVSASFTVLYDECFTYLLTYLLTDFAVV